MNHFDDLQFTAGFPESVKWQNGSQQVKLNLSAVQQLKLYDSEDPSSEEVLQSIRNPH